MKNRVPESKGPKGYQECPSDPSGERLNGHRSQERRQLRVVEPPPDTLDSPWPCEVHGSEEQCRTAKESNQDIGSRSVGSENCAVHDGLAGSDPDNRGDCREHADEENHRRERGRPNSGPLAA